MTYKNLCKDRELTGDLLRQRRDFYAVSLGLILFHLAGGVMKDTATLSTLPVKLAHPQVLYWSAWSSFVYFAWRYWVLDPGSVRLFKEEWDRQSRASAAFMRVCLSWVNRYRQPSQDTQQITALLRAYRPSFPPIEERAQLDLHSMKHLATGNSTVANVLIRATVSAEDIAPLRRIKIAGFFRAIFLERTASDLLLPYAMGAAAIVVSIVTAITGHSL